MRDMLTLRSSRRRSACSPTRALRRTAGSVDRLGFDSLEQRIVLSSATEWLADFDGSVYGPEIAALIQNVTTTGHNEFAEPHGERSSTPAELGPSVLESANLIRLNDFRDNALTQNIDGSGFATVIIDTGIDLDHPGFGQDLDNDGVSDRIVFSFDFSGNNDPDASDTNGHGSNVSYIAAGGSVFGGPVAYFGSGVAPGADVIHLKVFPDGDNPLASFADIEEALQWVIANTETYNIASVNLSLGSTTNFGAPESGPLNDEFEVLNALNVVVVSSAGNAFFEFQAQGVGYPAADPNSLAIGAVFDSNIGSAFYGSGAGAFSTGADRITPFSQRSTGLTEVFAPGASITGADFDGGFVSYHGTSQAAPHIAGVATLMQQLFFESTGRRLTVAEFRQALANGSDIIFDGDDEDDNTLNTFQAYKRVNVTELVKVLPIPPVPTSLTALLPGAQVVDNSLVFTGADIANEIDWRLIFGDEMFIYEGALSGAFEFDGQPAEIGDVIGADTVIRWTPDDLAFTQTLPAINLRGFDGRLFTVDTIEFSIYINEPPSISQVDSLGVAIEKQGFAISIDEILASLAPTDAENDDLDIRLLSVSSGTLRRADTGTLVTGDNPIELTTIGDLIWIPGDLDANDSPIFTVAAFDPFNASQTVDISAYVEVSPRFTFFNPFDVPTAPKSQTVTYEDILALTDLNDPNGDIFSLVISSVFNGSLFRDGAEVDLSAGPIDLRPGDSLVWTPVGTQQGAYAAFGLIASDGALSSDPFLFRVRFAESAPTGGGGGGGGGNPEPGGEDLTPPPAFGSIDDLGGLFVFARDTEGDLIVVENLSGNAGDWTATDLSTVLALGEDVGDPVTWFDPLTGKTFAAATVDGRVYLFRETNDGAWTAIDLTTQLPDALAIDRGLTFFTDTNDRTYLAGIADNDDLVIYFQTGVIDAFGNAQWAFRNLYEQDLRPRKEAIPEFTGDLIAYVTPWNGLHIAGLDPDGDIQAVWISPALKFWQSDNISAITGAAPLTGGLTAFLTPWGGVNLAGADTKGDLNVTWWVPGFGGDWRLSNLTEIADGPQLTAASTASFVTDWGGLNVAGIDTRGDLVVYWWSPQSGMWRADSLSDLTESEKPVGKVRGLAGEDATMHLFARAADSDLLRFFWSPTEGWNSENTSEAAGIDVSGPPA